MAGAVMDPNEAYRLLSEAVERLRSWLDKGNITAQDVADGITYDAEQVVEHWDALDGWMRKSGFPPVAWNSPVTVGRGSEVVNGRWTPVNRGGRPPADTSWVKTTERADREQARLLDSTRSRDLKIFQSSRPPEEHTRPVRGHRDDCSLLKGNGLGLCNCWSAANGDLCKRQVGSGFCGLDSGHEGGCEW